MKKFTVITVSQKAQKSMLCISFSLMTMILLLFFATPAKSQCPTSVVYSAGTSFTFNNTAGTFPTSPSPTSLKVTISAGTGATGTYTLTVSGTPTNTTIVTDLNGLNQTSVASVIEYYNASTLIGTTCSTSTPLPVKISSVGAKVEGTKNVINWVTSTEVNNDRFEIERTVDGRFFTTIGTVKGAGNSNQNLRYEFIDNTPVKGCRYRLKQIDFNGDFEYSRIIIPEVGTDLGGKIEMIVRPNPSNSSAVVTVSLNNTDLSNNNLVVTDAYGRVVFQTTFEDTSSLLELPNLAAGLYTITVLNGNIVLNKRFTILNE